MTGFGWLVLSWAAGTTVAATPDASEIMARVAANQDRAAQARGRYVYAQKVRARMIRTNGKLAREEFRTYTVTPGAAGAQKKLTEFKGTYESKGKLHEYHEPGFEHKDIDLDADVINTLTEDLVDDRKSRDGISSNVFPLTSEEQKNYVFRYAGELVHQGRKAHRIEFRPKQKSEAAWTGEAIIDQEEYEPVNVFSKFAMKIPWGVKVLLGSDVKQLGFAVNYQRVAPGVWFPVSYGTEFRLEMLWGYKRVITMNLTSGDFREAKVESQIQFATDEK